VVKRGGHGVDFALLLPTGKERNSKIRKSHILGCGGSLVSRTGGYPPVLGSNMASQKPTEDCQILLWWLSPVMAARIDGTMEQTYTNRFHKQNNKKTCHRC
jgi:hypothetical protein